VRLGELLRSAGRAELVPPGAGRDVEIASVTLEVEEVRPGTLFICRRGRTQDTHDLAAQAVGRGATALVVEAPLGLGVPEVVVGPDQRAAVVGALAASLAGRPAERLATVAVTGTNGKTTVTHLVSHVLNAAGVSAEVVGTLDGGLTTPDAPALQGRLAAALERGARAVALEASSHGLVQGRLDGMVVDVAVFTNLGRDHLDYHGDQESYYQAKALLFRPGRARRAVVNVGDAAGRRLADEAEIPVVPFARHQLPSVVVGDERSRFVWRSMEVEIGLPGRPGVENALAAAEAILALGLGLGPEEIASGLRSAPGVPGRFERFGGGDAPTVIVDFAHTPDALGAVLEVARSALGPSGCVSVVFGCGGERDRAKRAEMGAVAERFAERIVVTSDNPRSEDPAQIADEVLSGISGLAKVTVELDRRRAIAEAIAAASLGDVVVVAGKGHERYQEIAGERLPFSDQDEVRRVLGSAR